LVGWFTEVVVFLSYMEEKPASNMLHMQMLQEVGCLIGWFTEVVMLLSYMEEKPASNMAHTHSILADFSSFHRSLKAYVRAVHQFRPCCFPFVT
jgi:hypothetical protein